MVDISEPAGADSGPGVGSEASLCSADVDSRCSGVGRGGADWGVVAGTGRCDCDGVDTSALSSGGEPTPARLPTGDTNIIIPGGAAPACGEEPRAPAAAAAAAAWGSGLLRRGARGLPVGLTDRFIRLSAQMRPVTRWLTADEDCTDGTRASRDSRPSSLLTVSRLLSDHKQTKQTRLYYLSGDNCAPSPDWADGRAPAGDCGAP